MRFVWCVLLFVLFAIPAGAMEDRWALEEEEDLSLKPLLMVEVYSAGFVIDAVPMNDFGFYGRAAVTGIDLRSEKRVILRGDILITEMIDNDTVEYCAASENRTQWDVSGYSGGNMVGRWIGRCLTVDMRNRVSFYDDKTGALITYSGSFIANEVPR